MREGSITTILTIASFLSGFFLGSKTMLDAVRNEAIEAGVAHWSIDPTTGEKVFVFQPPTNPSNND